MGFDKVYPNRKDKRKPFRKSARFDRSCRHGGSCDYCLGNRTHNTDKKIAQSNDKLKDI